MNLDAIIQAGPVPRRRGRPKAMTVRADRLRREAIVGRWLAGNESAEVIAEAFGCHAQTVRRWAKELAIHHASN